MFLLECSKSRLTVFYKRYENEVFLIFDIILYIIPTRRDCLPPLVWFVRGNLFLVLLLVLSFHGLLILDICGMAVKGLMYSSIPESQMYMYKSPASSSLISPAMHTLYNAPQLVDAFLYLHMRAGGAAVISALSLYTESGDLCRGEHALSISKPTHNMQRSPRFPSIKVPFSIVILLSPRESPPLPQLPSPLY